MAIVAACSSSSSLLATSSGTRSQARREGMEIDGITLWLFGGVARFKGMFPSAGAEFRIAIAGPLVSLALGGLFVLLGAGVARRCPTSLDGGRRLARLHQPHAARLQPAAGAPARRRPRAARGALAGEGRLRVGDARRREHRAGFGFLMIAGGVFLFIFEGSFSGAWLAFIGWFLLYAATAERRYLTPSRHSVACASGTS